jgi:ribosomal protein L7/L12
MTGISIWEEPYEKRLAHFLDLLNQAADEYRITLTGHINVSDNTNPTGKTLGLSFDPTTGYNVQADTETYNVYMYGHGMKKIQCIKAVREVINNGLKEAKDMVEASEFRPVSLDIMRSYEDADYIVRKIEAAGGKAVAVRTHIDKEEVEEVAKRLKIIVNTLEGDK